MCVYDNDDVRRIIPHPAASPRIINTNRTAYRYSKHDRWFAGAATAASRKQHRLAQPWPPLLQLQAAYVSGAIVRSWAQRWTYQLFTHNDWALAIAARRDERLPNAYFLKEKGRVLALAKVLTDELHQHASLSRDAVATLLADSSATPVSNNLRYAILQVVAARGHFAFNPLTDNLQRMAAPTMATAEAMQTLMRRFVRGFGPVQLKDFCKWAGISVTHARSNWAACVPDWQPVNYADETLYVAETTPILADVLAHFD